MKALPGLLLSTLLLSAAPLGATATTDPYAGLLDFEEEVSKPIHDPFEGFNRTMFGVNRTLNKFVLRPVTNVYQTVVPDPVEKGLANVFDNLRVVPRVAGSLLQGKVDRAVRETGRFAVDTTVGIGGFFRPSDEMPALQVPGEDIGQALGKWGVGEGPFLVLPLLGPTTVRDLVGSVGDRAVNPLQAPFDVWNDWAAKAVFQAADVITGLPPKLDQLDQLEREAIDPYAALRNAYVNFRRAEVEK